MKCIVAVFFVAGCILAAKKPTPAPLADPPDGYVRNSSQGMNMIFLPIMAAKEATRPGLKTHTRRDSYVSVDLPALDDLRKARVAHDEYGLRDLLDSSRIVVVPQNTTVQIIDRFGEDMLNRFLDEDLDLYKQELRLHITICYNSRVKAPACAFVPAPHSSLSPAGLIKLKIRLLDGDKAGGAYWIVSESVVLPGIEPGKMTEGTLRGPLAGDLRGAAMSLWAVPGPAR